MLWKHDVLDNYLEELFVCTSQNDIKIITHNVSFPVWYMKNNTTFSLMNRFPVEALEYGNMKSATLVG
jgi:hypothetical protein